MSDGDSASGVGDIGSNAEVQSNVEVLDEEEGSEHEPTEEEIAAYAEFLGIDVAEEPHLMWIAAEGVSAPVPAPWKACQEGDEVFYFNFKTKESMWDHPCDSKFRGLVDKYRKLGPEGAPKDGERGFLTEEERSEGSRRGSLSPSGGSRSRSASPQRGPKVEGRAGSPGGGSPRGRAGSPGGGSPRGSDDSKSFVSEAVASDAGEAGEARRASSNAGSDAGSLAASRAPSPTGAQAKGKAEGADSAPNSAAGSAQPSPAASPGPSPTGEGGMDKAAVGEPKDKADDDEDSNKSFVSEAVSEAVASGDEAEAGAPAAAAEAKEAGSPEGAPAGRSVQDARRSRSSSPRSQPSDTSRPAAPGNAARGGGSREQSPGSRSSGSGRGGGRRRSGSRSRSRSSTPRSRRSPRSASSPRSRSPPRSQSPEPPAKPRATPPPPAGPPAAAPTGAALGGPRQSAASDNGPGSARSSNFSEVSEDVRSDWDFKSPAISARGESLEVNARSAGNKERPTAAAGTSRKGGPAVKTWGQLRTELQGLAELLESLKAIRSKQEEYLHRLKTGRPPVS